MTDAKRRWCNLMEWSGLALKRCREVKIAVRLRKKCWAILDVDNYDRDYRTEVFVEGDFETEVAARVRRDELVATTMTRPGGRFPMYAEDAERYLTVRHGSKGYYVFDGY